MSDLVTTEDVRDHMRSALEAIAGTHHAARAQVHIIQGDVDGTRSSPAYFTPETCPRCIADAALGAIDEAESREGGLL